MTDPKTSEENPQVVEISLGMRKKSTIRKRNPRRIIDCPNCGVRAFGLKKPMYDSNRKQIATHACSGGKNRCKRFFIAK